MNKNGKAKRTTSFWGSFSKSYWELCDEREKKRKELEEEDKRKQEELDRIKKLKKEERKKKERELRRQLYEQNHPKMKPVWARKGAISSLSNKNKGKKR